MRDRASKPSKVPPEIVFSADFAGQLPRGMLGIPYRLLTVIENHHVECESEVMIALAALRIGDDVPLSERRARSALRIKLVLLFPCAEALRDQQRNFSVTTQFHQAAGTNRENRVQLTEPLLIAPGDGLVRLRNTRCRRSAS